MNGETSGLSQVWELIPEAEKFSAMGGDANNMVDGKPGVYKDVEMLKAMLFIPDGGCPLFVRRNNIDRTEIQVVIGEQLAQ